MAKSKVEAILRREKENAFVLLICLDMNPPDVVEVAAMWGISLYYFKSLMEDEGAFSLP